MWQTTAVRAALAGSLYFGAVFAAGFVLGAVRVLVLLPRLGETAAVALELPVMLLLSWFVCRRVVDRFGIPPAFSHRLVMGGTAFGLLMLAEMGLSVLAFGRSMPEHLMHYATLAGLLGLAGQIAFAAFPALQGRTRG